jgi:hypothetical protein
VAKTVLDLKGVFFRVLSQSRSAERMKIDARYFPAGMNEEVGWLPDDHRHQFSQAGVDQLWLAAVHFLPADLRKQFLVRLSAG